MHLTEPTNRTLLLPCVLPYAVYVGVPSLLGLAPELSGRELDYALRIVLTGICIAWAWRRWPPLRGPGSPAASLAIGAVAGLVGLAAWVALLTPFVEPDGAAWSPAAFGLRLAAATLLVPLFEEVLLRGYVLGLVVQWQQARHKGAERPLDVALDECSILALEPGAWTGLAVLVSSVAFALGHAPTEWVAALVYGLLMAGLWAWRRDLLTCVAAHAVTNLSLAILVWHTGRWELW